jgi:hypothetical protein
MQMEDLPEHPADLDSHADASVIGKNALIMHVLEKRVNVTGVDPLQGKVKDLNLVSAALACDCPTTGETIILMTHQAVHIPTMEIDLLCPMQMRVNDVELQECPKFMEEWPSDMSHALHIAQHGDELCVLFGIRGVTSYFPTCKPTAVELADCRTFDLTSEEPEWDPSSSAFQEQEDACAQIFATQFGWHRAFPMKAKSEAHEAASLLFPRDGVPINMVMDGSKEQTLGEFRRKCCEASCQTKQTEDDTPWSNAAKDGVRELKKASARQTLKKHSPKCLWDDAMELQAHILSHTAGNQFGLNGETPETMLSGETADILEFAEFRWCDWIKFRDTKVPCAQDKLVLG